VGEAGSEYHRQVIIPGVIRLLGLEAGRRVLDVACGQGVLCRALQQRGMEVTGIDSAAELVEAARQRGPATIAYHIAEAQNLSFLAAGQFAGAVCVLALQNMNPLPAVFDSVARLLGPGAPLVMVMTHPCFRGAKETSWGWDGGNAVQYRRVDRYLLPRKVPIMTHPGEKTGQYTWTFHRPLQTYVRLLHNAGLAVDWLEEWPSHKTSEPGPRAAAENRARQEIPLFMALRAVSCRSRVGDT